MKINLWVRPWTISCMCHSQEFFCVVSGSFLGGGSGLGKVWDSERFMTIHIFRVFRQQMWVSSNAHCCGGNNVATWHKGSQKPWQNLLCCKFSHLYCLYWAAKKYFCWGSGSPSLDYWIIISYQGDIRGNQRSSSKCSVTWQQIYEKKRCHYKEGKKKKERSYSLGRKEET